MNPVEHVTVIFLWEEKEIQSVNGQYYAIRARGMGETGIEPPTFRLVDDTLYLQGHSHHKYNMVDKV